MYKNDVAYSVLLRRKCLVGGLCFEILKFVDLWIPIDGICVINCFFLGRGILIF